MVGVTVGYRRHSNNDSNLTRDFGRFPREVDRARRRWHFAQRVSGVAQEQLDDRPLFRSRELLQFRVAARRVRPAEPGLPGDSVPRMLLDAVRAPLHIGPEPVRRRLLASAWSIATLVAPPAVAGRLVTLRYRKNG